MTVASGLLTRLHSGVPGLDAILGGGFYRGGVYMVEGPPGGGKTILGNQICFHHAAKGQQALYVTLLAESFSRMLAHLSSMDFFEESLVPDRVFYSSAFKVVDMEGLPGLMHVLRETLLARQATLVVLDGLVSARDSSTSDNDYKKFIHELQTLASMTECTMLLLSSDDLSGSSRPEHTMVDGILELTDDVVTLRAVRHVRVRKLRGADPVRGRHSLTISNAGIAVRPRIEASLKRLAEVAPAIPDRKKRMGFRLPELDSMLRGGLPAGSITMLLGPSGSGKTTLGLQFLAAGVQLGESGLCFGFYERPSALVLRSDCVGVDLEGARRSGRLQFMWHPIEEANIDVLVERLLEAVKEHQPQRLFIDGMQGFQQAADVPERLRDVFSALAEQLEAWHVTTVYSVESPDLLGPAIEAPLGELSATTHNIVLMRHVEQAAQHTRLISVLKLRDSAHDTSIREFRITERGIHIAKADAEGGGRGSRPPQALASTGARSDRPSSMLVEHVPRSERLRRPPVPLRGSVLIVDDEFGLAELISEILTDRGYSTTIAINGELGLAAVEEAAPDLILLDVMMPVVDGAEMARRVRASPAHAAIPIVFMTALPGSVPRDQPPLHSALLHKPFSSEQLFRVIEQIEASRRPTTD